MKAILVLENGMKFTGISIGSEEPQSGEVVFNTAMTGYPESLTDPSYKGQILVSTYPLVGNYGVPGNETMNHLAKHYESDKVAVQGFIISDYSEQYSHWNASQSLSAWLQSQHIPAISGIDTRALTRVLRESGTMLGKIIFEKKDADWYDPNDEHLVKMVSPQSRTVYGKGKYKVVLFDSGVKNDINRCLLKRDTTVIRVPFDYDSRREAYDGLFITNGTGNPQRCTATINTLKPALGGRRPVFGICLGSQLMALAAGAKTYKLKYGHRSHNQPVRKVGGNQCVITSQKHGFAVDEKTLGNEWEALFVNVNDGSCEGIRHKTKPFFATQFHPEASGGPTDTEFLFDEFLALIKKSKQSYDH